MYLVHLVRRCESLSARVGPLEQPYGSGSRWEWPSWIESGRPFGWDGYSRVGEWEMSVKKRTESFDSKHRRQ